MFTRKNIPTTYRFQIKTPKITHLHYFTGTLGLDMEGNCYCVLPENGEDKCLTHVLPNAIHYRIM